MPGTARKAAPAKAAPAKAAPAKATPAAPAAPALDYSALAVTETATFEDKYRRLDGTPFVGFIRKSRESGKGLALTVPSATVDKVKGLIRLAADSEKLGVRFAVSKPDSNGNVQVAFKAKDKRADKGPRKPRQRQNESTSDFRTRVTAWETSTGKKYTA